MAPIIRTCSALLAALGAAAPALAEAPHDLAAYVRARAADADGVAQVAAAGYAEALAAAPGDAVVAIRAYRAALRVGDLALARRARGVLEAAGVAPADAALLALAEAAQAGDKAGALAAIRRLEGGPLAFLVAPLNAWAGYPQPPRALTTLAADQLDRRYGLDAGALIDLARGQSEAGLTVLRAQLSDSGGALDLRLAAARLLAAQGKRAAGLELLAGDDAAFAAARQRIDQPVTPGLGFGLARLLSRLAEDLETARAGTLGIAVARAALIVEPENDRARLLLGQALAADNAPTLALAALDRIARDSPFAGAAALQRVEVLASSGQIEAALAAARRLAEAPGAGAREAQRLGDLLSGAGRDAEAAAAYGTAIARAGTGASWGLYLQQGGALDRAGRWAEAEPLLARAVALAPDQPIALNYLGYARLEHGGDVGAARALLERAQRLKPDNASIADSLAWAYFLGGDAERALPLLERAALADPGNGTISEHLGDVYWRLGRRYEARYAWTAAAQLAAAEDAARLAAKLEEGLRR